MPSASSSYRTLGSCGYGTSLAMGQGRTLVQFSHEPPDSGVTLSPPCRPRRAIMSGEQRVIPQVWPGLEIHLHHLPGVSLLTSSLASTTSSSPSVTKPMTDVSPRRAGGAEPKSSTFPSVWLQSLSCTRHILSPSSPSQHAEGVMTIPCVLNPAHQDLFYGNLCTSPNIRSTWKFIPWSGKIIKFHHLYPH